MLRGLFIGRISAAAMRYYDYGPMRFSLARGFLLTVLVPLGVVLTLAACYLAFVGAPSYADAIRRALDDIGELYREYPQAALLMHALFFLKGLVYRRRYVSYGPTVLTFIAVGAVIWYAAQRLNLFPGGSAPAFASFASSSSGGEAPGESSSATRPDTPRPANPLALHVERPNRLQQERSTVAEVARAVPDAEGHVLFVGYLGSAAVVYELNQASAISVAPSALRPTTASSCPPYTSVMDGEPVSGCLAWVDDLYLGPVSLPRVQVFFTDQLPANWPARHVILGANATKQLAVDRSSAGVITVRRKPSPLAVRTS